MTCAAADANADDDGKEGAADVGYVGLAPYLTRNWDTFVHLKYCSVPVVAVAVVLAGSS